MRRYLGIGLAVGLLTLAGCGDDDSGTVCVDNDGDGYGADCADGDDVCDDDASNWTATGCADCVDSDGDGYGVDCDLGDDCDDGDASIYSGCGGCEDLDGDGHDAVDAVECPAGDDECDDDVNNWTDTGCADCVDSDGDGYGVDCDMGGDCDDTDAGIHTGCVACVDGDGDGHDGYDATTCPTGDDQCDGDGNNWTATGCTSCVDSDGDGYGTDCDLGDDCNDNAPLQTTICQSAHYAGDFLISGEDEVGVISYPGPAMTVLPLAGLDHPYGIDGMALSPDGSHIAVSGEDFTGANALQLYAADGTGTPVVLASYDLGWDADMDDLAFSPDGAWLAFRADVELSGGDAVYVVPTDGSAPPKLVTQVPPTSSFDVSNFVWSPDTSTTSRYLAYRGDMVTLNTYGLWVVDITAATPAPVEIETSDVQSSLAFSPQGLLYYRLLIGGVYHLLRSDVAGTNKEQVPGTGLTNAGGVEDASVGAFGISPSGTKLAFSADSPTADLYEVFVMDLATTTPVLVSSVGALTPAAGDTSGPSAWGPIVWSLDESMLCFTADWQLVAGEVDNDYSAYVLPAAAPAGGVRLLKPTTSGDNQDALSILFSFDSLRVFVMGDLVINNDTELYSTDDLTTPEQDPVTVRVQEAPAGGDISQIAVP